MRIQLLPLRQASTHPQVALQFCGGVVESRNLQSINKVFELMIDSTRTELCSTRTHWFNCRIHHTILILDKVIRSNLIVFLTHFTNVTTITICLVKTMEAAKAKETSNFAKRAKSGITHLAPAAIIMATAETIAERKATSNSALLGTIHNARWWLSHTPTKGVLEG
ncbi:hypothetical protein NDA13_006424 [Ustilago tritici]|nr:hypothetical protein NDA13_006424 [Ustilago tritici]